MRNGITKHSTWHNTSDDSNYTVGDIYINDLGETLIPTSCTVDGFYDEWVLSDFNREFTFVSEYSL